MTEEDVTMMIEEGRMMSEEMVITTGENERKITEGQMFREDTRTTGESMTTIGNIKGGMMVVGGGEMMTEEDVTMMIEEGRMMGEEGMRKGGKLMITTKEETMEVTEGEITIKVRMILTEGGTIAVIVEDMETGKNMTEEE